MKMMRPALALLFLAAAMQSAVYAAPAPPPITLPVAPNNALLPTNFSPIPGWPMPPAGGMFVPAPPWPATYFFRAPGTPTPVITVTNLDGSTGTLTPQITLPGAQAWVVYRQVTPPTSSSTSTPSSTSSSGMPMMQ